MPLLRVTGSFEVGTPEHYSQSHYVSLQVAQIQKGRETSKWKKGKPKNVEVEKIFS